MPAAELRERVTNGRAGCRSRGYYWLKVAARGSRCVRRSRRRQRPERVVRSGGTRCQSCDDVLDVLDRVAPSPTSPRAPPAFGIPSDARARPRAKQQKDHERPSLVALGRENLRRRRAKEVALQALEQSLPIRATPARPGRTCEAREGSAAGCSQPQPQPLQRCSPLRGSPARPMTRRPPQSAPRCGGVATRFSPVVARERDGVKHGHRWLRNVAVGHRDDGGNGRIAAGVHLD